ncbi:MAG: helix-turn-helix domain-containing protein [Mycobacteriales bacterium]
MKPDTVRRWAARGEIACLRLRRLLRFRREELDAWLHSRASGGPTNLSPGSRGERSGRPACVVAPGRRKRWSRPCRSLDAMRPLVVTGASGHFAHKGEA